MIGLNGEIGVEREGDGARKLALRRSMAIVVGGGEGGADEPEDEQERERDR